MEFEQAVKELGLVNPCTGKVMSAEELLEELKDDVVWAVKRPGSWEGANMLTVFQAHGYFNDQE